MQVRDLIEALQRFDPYDEVRIEVSMPPEPEHGRCGPWFLKGKLEEVRRDRNTPTLTTSA